MNRVETRRKNFHNRAVEAPAPPSLRAARDARAQALSRTCKGTKVRYVRFNARCVTAQGPGELQEPPRAACALHFTPRCC